MQGVDADEDNVVILVYQLDSLLRLPVHLGAHQAAELSDAVVDMHHIVAYGELVQFLQREGNLSTPCLVALEAVFMETVEKLVVGKEARLQLLVGKPGMDGLVHRRERYIFLPVVEDGVDTGGLLLHVA